MGRNYCHINVLWEFYRRVHVKTSRPVLVLKVNICYFLTGNLHKKSVIYTLQEHELKEHVAKKLRL